MPNTGRAYSLECVISFVYSERAWAKREWTVYCTAPVNVSACNSPLGPHSREFRLRSGRRDRKVLLAERPARHRIESGRTETPTPKPKPKPKQHTRPFRMHASSTETNPHHCWNTSTGPDPHAAPEVEPSYLQESLVMVMETVMIVVEQASSIRLIYLSTPLALA